MALSHSYLFICLTCSLIFLWSFPSLLDATRSPGSSHRHAPIIPPSEDTSLGDSSSNDTSPGASSSSGVFDVTKYGAVANGKTESCKAFESAWAAACSCSGGGPSTFLVPEGSFLVGPITFKGPCKTTPKVEIRGTLKAPADLSAFHGLPTWIEFKDLSNLDITGSGTGVVDGQGESSWAHGQCENSGGKCKNNPISLKLTKVNCGSVSSLKLLNRVHVKNCTIEGTDNGVRVKTWPGSGPSKACNFTFEDIVVKDVKNPIIIDQEYCPGHKCSARGPSKVKFQVKVAVGMQPIEIMTEEANGFKATWIIVDRCFGGDKSLHGNFNIALVNDNEEAEERKLLYPSNVNLRTESENQLNAEAPIDENENESKIKKPKDEIGDPMYFSNLSESEDPVTLNQLIKESDNLKAETRTDGLNRYKERNARPLFLQGAFHELLDQDTEDLDMYEISRVMSAAIQCTKTKPLSRPNMSQVVSILRGENLTVIESNPSSNGSVQGG
ncbi:Exopolygalacturonase [Thalictrum thalictroides]|uniref:Exopolygalacturonase n=1 Tax=Thalictrum thalictroides TaxID=46969 RepID=A0A7J6VVI8_THATH|nr:Exopolygalacturonase [Thalictrum thalictroides]